MEPLSLRHIAEAVGAALPARPEVQVTGVCTDSRQDCRGCVFFALKGERTDGHMFVRQAAEAGAVAAVVEDAAEDVSVPQLVVDDTLRALGSLSRWYAQRFAIPKIGITGSVGKTSVRSMTAAVLGARYRVHQSARNHNNELGVPLTLLGLTCAHQVAVVEMAMRGPGQIAYLADLFHPTAGVVTNIGVSHIELLGSRVAIAEAKAELMEALPDDGAAVLPADDDFAELLIQRARRSPNRRVVTFGTGPAADYRVTNLRITPDGTTEFRINDVAFIIPAAGVQHGMNAAAACAAGGLLDVDLLEAAEALRHWNLPDMRLQMHSGPHGITVLDDTYNAAPDSMRAALRTLERMARNTGRRAVAVLGDMKELGEASRQSHEELGRLPEMSAVSLLITAGVEAERIAATAPMPEKRTCADAAEAAKVVPPLLRQGDIVLVKGSRAMAMEQVVGAILQQEIADAPE